MTGKPNRRSLSPLFRDPTDAMELAKKIIGNKIQIEPGVLAEVGVTKTNPKFTRIAAIYAAGFVGGDLLAAIFQDILRDETDDVDVRGHAAEALGNIRDQTAITLLQNVLEHEPSAELRVSCEYALHELGV